MADDPLNFGIDIEAMRDRAVAMKYFLSVTDILEATEALDAERGLPARPPAAFVAIASERAEKNNTIGGHSQRVRCEVAILFVESAMRADRQSRDQLDKVRKAIIRQFIAWKVPGSLSGLEYSRYRVVSIGNGLAWGEVTFTTDYRLTAQT